jgi:hypothetical protein
LAILLPYLISYIWVPWYYKQLSKCQLSTRSIFGLARTSARFKHEMFKEAALPDFLCL